jgi:hypothetical protein
MAMSEPWANCERAHSGNRAQKEKRVAGFSALRNFQFSTLRRRKLHVPCYKGIASAELSRNMVSMYIIGKLTLITYL